MDHSGTRPSGPGAHENNLVCLWAILVGLILCQSCSNRVHSGTFLSLKRTSVLFQPHYYREQQRCSLDDAQSDQRQCYSLSWKYNS